MLESQNKLNELLSKIPDVMAPQFKDIITSQQSMIMNLFNTLDSIKERQREHEVFELTKKLESLETRISNERSNPYKKLESLITAQNQPQVTKRQTLAGAAALGLDPKLNKKPQVKVLKDEEVKEMKIDYLGTKEKKENLLKVMGLHVEDEKLDLGPDKALGDLNFEEGKGSIRDKLKALKEIKRRNSKLIKVGNRFRGVARVIYALFYLKKYAKQNIGKMKQEQQVYLNHDITLHLDIAKAWLLQLTRPVILSVFFRA